MKLISTILFLFVFLNFACEKPKSYSPIPAIEYNNIEIINGKDELGNLIKQVIVTFTFVDGDGDLGLATSDTTGDFAPSEAFYYNLKFNLYEKRTDTLILDTVTKPYFRFEELKNKNSANPVLKGKMIVPIDFQMALSWPDSSLLEFYIYDRSQNQSNIEQTKIFSLND
ncbi:MAG: hypothetical protein JXR60_01190 [Bacteroidales bacterium]|nr:hypothetical protein [Bacteroidales bacterium]